MKSLTVFLILVLMATSVFALANTYVEPESDSLELNLSGVIKDEAGKISVAKLLGGLVLSFLLVSEVFIIIRNKKKRS